PVGSGLASLPPLVFAGVGVVGLWVLPGLGSTWVAVVLAVAVLPRLTLGFADVSRLVEPEERLAAAALGASRWQVFSRVVGPGSLGGWLACALRAAATMTGLLAPLLLLPLGQVSSLPIEAFRHAIAGDLGTAAGMVLVVLVVMALVRGAALMVERRPAWRLR
ncbi:MAG: ABC transporter permease subunit, partial [Myxococcota bacterium]